MATALITHPACLAHNAGDWHPECPDRLRAVLGALEAEEFAALLRETAPPATPDQLALAHPRDYVDAILAIRPGPGELIQLDADTAMNEASAEAACRAAGGAVHAVDAVMQGWARAAFVATRPPGHHAEPGRPMGFCLFNNAAIAAHWARTHYGLHRIAVVDFDVHHGNGTQAMFFDDPNLFYASSHQSPCYPGTGQRNERGCNGNIVNAPLAPYSDSIAFRAAWSGTLLPALDRFTPELLIVSAGFDAHKADPLAQLALETTDFAWITTELLAIANHHTGGRIVSLLEGGYDLDALAASAAAHVRVLIGAGQEASG
ncbi:MAG TPA: histone deacetylase family protein [Acetobacteraceae bacterium]|nr:histone deacetylase family protein [Acetobacteraceae bacterium]